MPVFCLCFSARRTLLRTSNAQSRYRSEQKSIKHVGKISCGRSHAGTPKNFQITHIDYRAHRAVIFAIAWHLVFLLLQLLWINLVCVCVCVLYLAVWIFTARQHSFLCRESDVLAIVNPSVCPSVTRWHSVKMSQATITRSSLEDSSMTSFLIVNFSEKFQWEHRERGAEWERGRKNGQFLANSPYLRNGAR